MTLIVGGVNGNVAWMVSDTLITGGTIQLREREYQVKCAPSKDMQALVAFSGDAHNGARLIEEAAALPASYDIANMLATAQAEHPKIDFRYALRAKVGSTLFKISDGLSLKSRPLTLVTRAHSKHFSVSATLQRSSQLQKPLSNLYLARERQVRFRTKWVIRHSLDASFVHARAWSRCRRLGHPIRPRSGRRIYVWVRAFIL